MPKTEGLGTMKMYEPSPAYSPMDFDPNVGSTSITPENSRAGSPSFDTDVFDSTLIDKINTRIESKDKFYSLEV